MARKLIETISVPNSTMVAKVYRDSTWDEYRVVFYLDGKKVEGADMHTSDNDDAMRTALSECNRHVKADPRQTRTDTLLGQWKGHSNEWNALHGVLCMSHGLKGADYDLVESCFDGIRIAGRLDEINASFKVAA
jgi:hypothetical protein